SRKAGKKIKKQPTPSPDRIILGVVSKSGSKTLQTTNNPPAITSNPSGIFLLNKRRMTGENMNNSTRMF
ncbi:MAG: hypothetical protein ACXADF_08690, partial [Candidatus Thorarchaeota archaeon]